MCPHPGRAVPCRCPPPARAGAAAGAGPWGPRAAPSSPPPPRRPSPAPFVGGLAGTRAPSAHMTAQTERAIHPGPGADKAEAAQKPTRLPGSEGCGFQPTAPARCPAPGSSARGARATPSPVPGAAERAGRAAGGRAGRRWRAALIRELDPRPLPSSCPGSVGAVGCPEHRGAGTQLGASSGKLQGRAGRVIAELLQDGAEPPRPWQMLIPGSVSGSRQSPRPRRPPLPGEPREPHPSARPTRLQRPPGSRGPARGAHAALWGRTPALGGSQGLRGRSPGVRAGWGWGSHHGAGHLRLPPGPSSTQGGSEGGLETQAWLSGWASL